MSTVKYNLDELIRQRDPAVMDSLPVGAIQVDRSGDILYCNAVESAITGCDPKLTVGKNLFKEVSPCTNRPDFLGRFKDVVRQDTAMASFEFIFDARNTPEGKSKAVRTSITIKRDVQAGSFWIFVQSLTPHG